MEYTWLPEGRGMFVQSLAGLPSDWPSVLPTLGLKWVAVQVLWQTGPVSKYYNTVLRFKNLDQSYGCNHSNGFMGACERAQIMVVPFAYTVPGKEEECCVVLDAAAQEWGSQAVIIDPEAPYSSPTAKHAPAAKKLAGMLTERFGSWGVTSYGAPWFFKHFPFKEFNTANFAIPQTYGNYFSDPDIYGRAYRNWTSFGLKNLVGTYGTFGKDPKEMQALLTTVAQGIDSGLSTPATIGWKWETTSEAEWEYIKLYLP